MVTHLALIAGRRKFSLAYKSCCRPRTLSASALFQVFESQDSSPHEQWTRLSYAMPLPRTNCLRIRSPTSVWCGWRLSARPMPCGFSRSILGMMSGAMCLACPRCVLLRLSFVQAVAARGMAFHAPSFSTFMYFCIQASSRLHSLRLRSCFMKRSWRSQNCFRRP